jgi:hypothetical protein
MGLGLLQKLWVWHMADQSVLYLFKLSFQSCFQGIKQCTIREEN